MISNRPLKYHRMEQLTALLKCVSVLCLSNAVEVSDGLSSFQISEQ